jgi:hypothetical protein
VGFDVMADLCGEHRVVERRLARGSSGHGRILAFLRVAFAAAHGPGVSPVR